MPNIHQSNTNLLKLTKKHVSDILNSTKAYSEPIPAYSNYFSKMRNKPSLLLHICCAPCSPHAIELLQKDYDVTAYFYDPNIHPEEEYRFRLEEMERFSHEISLPLIASEYDADRWFDITKGHERDKEKGERCNLCFDLRLDRTAQFAKENGFELFTTVLSTSPHKDAKMINNIGKILSEKHGVNFLETDFKKKDGFKKSVSMSKEYGLKRQDYCGCIYSVAEGPRPQFGMKNRIGLFPKESSPKGRGQGWPKIK